MKRRCFLALSLIVVTAVPSLAGDTSKADAGVIQLSAEQIQKLLSGNTITGTWGSATYTQYYGESGFTVYIEDGRPPSRGKWRVKEDTNQYDSWWENTGWTPYTVMMTNTGYAWVNGNTLESFKVLAGKQADF